MYFLLYSTRENSAKNNDETQKEHDQDMKCIPSDINIAVNS